MASPSSPAAPNQDGSAFEATTVFLRRRWRVIAAVFVLVSAVALASAFVRPKLYEASASLLFRDQGLDQKLFGSAFFQQQRSPDREAATNARLVRVDDIAPAVSAALGNQLSAERISDTTEVASEGETDLVSITTTNRDPRLAARTANLVALRFIAVRKAADRAKVREAQQLIDGQLASLTPAEARTPRARSLQGRSEQLEILASLQTGNVEVAASAAIPKSAASPRPIRSLLVGVVLGLLAGLVVGVLRERLDSRVSEEKEFEALFGAPLLATVPRSRSLAAARRPGEVLESDAESFRLLRANLRYFNTDSDIRAVAVTSAQVGDGKSITSWNLACAAAETGGDTLLIESDLRRPGLTERLTAYAMGSGLSSVLAGRESLSSVVVRVPLDDGAADSSDAGFDILFAGPSPPNPTDLLSSSRMTELLEAARATYDFVIVDTPPTTVVADAIPLLLKVDGVIVVGRINATERRAARDLGGQLTNLRARVLGVVVNGVGASRSYSYYTETRPRGQTITPESEMRQAPTGVPS